MSRKDFTQTTKTKLAQRAGYQCSHPDCDIVTIGPGAGREEVSNIGEAAHIFSASKKGPRGQGGLTDKQLKSIENGIWMCKVHARLVDTNDGRGFTSTQLISWRDLHEEKIKKQQGRLHRKLGWISNLLIGDNPVFVPNSKIDFGKITYVEGAKNGSGKSAICEWISSLVELNQLKRWQSDCKTNFCVEFFNPDKNILEISIAKESVSVKANGKAVAFNPLPVGVVYFSGEELQGLIQKFSLPEAICRFLRADRISIDNLLRKVGTSVFSLVSNLRFEWEYPEEEDSFEKREVMVCDFKGSAPNITFNGLSGGQQQIVLLELAITKAQMLSEHIPVILILELEQLSLDNSYLQHYFKHLMSSNISFQTLVTSMRYRDLKWEGWSRYELIGSETNVHVRAVN